jgi:signal transduction histidine kinase
MSASTAVTADQASILMVDDNDANLLALEAVLEPLGHRLVWARSGREAVKRFLEEDFVLVIMDVQMPGLDGYGTVEMLRRLDQMRDVPVVFLTAFYNLEEHVHRGCALGAADYVTKPFDPVVFRAKIGALVALYVRGQRAERARREEMDRMKDLLFAGIGHDLRNPLHSILAASNMLGRVTTTEEVRRDLAEVIERAGARMAGIVDDILDLTRERFDGGVPVAPEPTDLSTTCRAVIGELQSAYPDRAIDIVVDGDVSGEWDVSRMSRVVSNLVGNAIQHTRSGPVQVYVTSNRTHVILRVHNDGGSIPAALLELLFEPFRRAGDAPERLGLGLYIARAIVRAHGGTIDATSSEEEGTTFTVTLPRAPARQVPSGERVLRELESGASG